MAEYSKELYEALLWAIETLLPGLNESANSLRLQPLDRTVFAKRTLKALNHMQVIASFIDDESLASYKKEVFDAVYADIKRDVETTKKAVALNEAYNEMQSIWSDDADYLI